MREICTSGSMSGDWKREHGRRSDACMYRKSRNRMPLPKFGAPVFDSTDTSFREQIIDSSSRRLC